MKRIILTILILISSSQITDEKNINIPDEFYLKWENETMKPSSVWFNLPKEKRNEIIENVYKLKK